MRLYFLYAFFLALIIVNFFSSSVMATDSPINGKVSKGLLNNLSTQHSVPLVGASFKNLRYRFVKSVAPRGRKYDFRYIEIGAGPAIWQTSHEPLMENQRNAIHFFIEYGDMLKPLSYVAGVNFNPAFIQEGYLLEPNYYFFNLKYSPSRKWYNWPVWMNIYGLLGASYWQASLTNTNFGNAGSNELLTEKDSGLGFMTGAGVSFEFFNFSLITQFTYELGVGQYEAGAFQPQDVHTGSAQINVMLSYRFFLSGLQWRCPTYK